MSQIKVLIHPVTPFQQNAPILYCEESKKCAFVDPGGDIDILLNVAKDNKLIPEKILLTHGHIDHAGGASELSEILNIEIHGPHVTFGCAINVASPIGLRGCLRKIFLAYFRAVTFFTYQPF